MEKKFFLKKSRVLRSHEISLYIFTLSIFTIFIKSKKEFIQKNARNRFPDYQKPKCEKKNRVRNGYFGVEKVGVEKVGVEKIVWKRSVWKKFCGKKSVDVENVVVLKKWTKNLNF